MCRCRWRRRRCPSTSVMTVDRLSRRMSMPVEVAVVLVDGSVDSGSAVAACVDDVRRRQCRQWVGSHQVCRCRWRCCWWRSPAVSRELQSAEHVETAVLGAGSVDDGSAVASCVGVCGGGSAARRPQSRVSQPAEQLETAVLTDGSVESKSAVASCVGVGGGGLVQDDRSRECSSRQRQCRYWIGCRLVCRCRWRRR